jgi:hypothetical protein
MRLVKSFFRFLRPDHFFGSSQFLTDIQGDEIWITQSSQSRKDEKNLAS